MKSQEYDPKRHNARIEFRSYPNGSYVAVLLVNGEEQDVILGALAGNFAKLPSVRERFEQLINDAMILDIRRYTKDLN